MKRKLKNKMDEKVWSKFDKVFETLKSKYNAFEAFEHEHANILLQYIAIANIFVFYTWSENFFNFGLFSYVVTSTIAILTQSLDAEGSRIFYSKTRSFLNRYKWVFTKPVSTIIKLGRMLTQVRKILPLAVGLLTLYFTAPAIYSFAFQYESIFFNEVLFTLFWTLLGPLPATITAYVLSNSLILGMYSSYTTRKVLNVIVTFQITMIALVLFTNHFLTAI